MAEQDDKIVVDDIDVLLAIDKDGAKDEGWMIAVGTVGAAVAIKAGILAIPAIASSGPAIAQILSQTQQHIMQGKHLWDKVVSDSNSWQQISTVISNVMANGVESTYGSALKKTLEVGNYTVTVTYKIIDGIIRISDAWVNQR